MKYLAIMCACLWIAVVGAAFRLETQDRRIAALEHKLGIVTETIQTLDNNIVTTTEQLDRMVTIDMQVARAWGWSTKPLSMDQFRRLAKVESSGDPCAVSLKDARGLFQVQPRTADEVWPGSSEHLFTPIVNATDSLLVLHKLGTRRDPVSGLTAYGWGAARAKYGIVTSEFAKKVLAR